MAKKSGPKPKTFSEHDRGMVRGMAIGGVPQERIAEYLAINVKTLRVHFNKELVHGMDEVKALAVSNMIHHLRNRDKAFSMFVLKTQCGYRETNHIEHSGQIDTQPVLYVIAPDAATNDKDDDGISGIH